MPNIIISKSRYIAGLQCPKLLWLECYESEKADPISAATQYLFDQGKLIEQFAHKQFPDGILIKNGNFNLSDNIAITKDALEAGATTLFEAAFSFANLYAAVDILQKNSDNTWNIFEIKSSTEVKDEHIDDVSLQKYVLEQNGLKIQQTFLMHINKKCAYPDLTNLFITEDITAAVKNKSENVIHNLSELAKAIQEKFEPKINIGAHCDTPYSCPFKTYCWSPLGDKAVFYIPQLNKRKKIALQENNILTLDQLPLDYELSDNQWEYVHRMLTYEVTIDTIAIQAELAKLQYPLYFLDFETDSPAIPRFNGFHPYQRVPFQFSCHVLTKNNAASHFEFLHPDKTDPRLAFIQALTNCIAKTGSIIVYNKAFENGILQELARAFTEHAEPLLNIAKRLWDQLDIFKKYYKHPAFGHSNSIKNILPVLVPELSYKNLTIQKGDEAAAMWNKMINTTDKTLKNQIATDLKRYCHLDTLAMVEIHKKLLATN